MSGSLIVTDVLELETQRKGAQGISLTHWTDTLEPEITLGSWIEIAGAIIEFTANEDIDSTNAWAGFGNSTLVYGYINGVTYVGVLTAAAPTWNTELQGYYDATGQHRYWGSIYKSSTGTYTRKNIFRNIQAIYLKNYAHETDAYSYTTAGTSVLWTATTNNSVGTLVVSSTKTFIAKKPLSLQCQTTRVSGDTLGALYNSNLIYVAAHGGYKLLRSTNDNMQISINPGKYKWIVYHTVSGGLNQGVRRHTIYVNGLYGGTSITKDACIDT